MKSSPWKLRIFSQEGFSILHAFPKGFDKSGRMPGNYGFSAIAPNLGSSSECANGTRLSIGDFYRNVEDGPKGKSILAVGIICFRGPKEHA